MTFNDWLRNTKDRFYTEPFPIAVKRSVETFEEGAYRRLGITTKDTIEGGTNIYDLPEWDVLIVLDACRPDIFRQVSREYAWIDSEIETYTTVGGYSLHWLEQTFTSEYQTQMQDTTFLAWNPYTDFVDRVSSENFKHFEPVHEYAWSDELGCVPPSEITNTACESYHTPRDGCAILWYQQPHAPYRTLLDKVETLSEEIVGDEDNSRLTVWNLLRKGEISEYEAVIACADMLRWCLDDLERFLEGLPKDTTVRITADHGELFGESGILGHPKTNYHDEQLKVPLASVDVSRIGESVRYESQKRVSESTEQRLEALGYK